MRKRMILLWLSVCIGALLCAGALAQGKDHVLFDRIGALEDSSLLEIFSIQVLDDTLYMLDLYDDLYRYGPTDVEPLLLDRPWEELDVQNGILCSDGSALYLISGTSGEGFRWDEGSWTQVFQLELRDFQGRYGTDLYQPVILGDFLYALRPDDYSRGKHQLIRFALEDGTYETLDMSGLTQLMAYRADQLLVVSYHKEEALGNASEMLSLKSLNLDGEVLAELATLPYTHETYVAYETIQDTVFAASGGEFLRLTQDSWETVGTVNSIYAENVRQTAALSGRFILMGYNGVSISDLSGTAVQTPPVCIAGFGGNDETISIFRKEHPEIPVRVWEDRFESVQEMADTVRSGDTEIDIFVLESTADLARWEKKGFAAPLDSAIIRETVALMYPQVQQVLSYEDDVIAIPSSTSFSVLGYHPEIVEKFGYEGPPASVREYVEMLLRWQQEFDGDHDEYAFDFSGYHSDEMYRNLAVRLLLSQYVMSWPEEAGTLSLDTPEFREILSLIGQLSSGNETMENERSYLYSDTALFQTGNWVHIGWDELGLDLVPYEILPLPPFVEGDSPHIEMSMPVYVLNPNSINRDQALKVLEGLATAIPTRDAYVLYPDRNEPVENPDYVRSSAESTALIEELEAALEIAQPNEKGAIEDEISRVQNGLEYWDENRWAYAPEQIATLRELMPYAVFREDVLYDPHGEQEPAFLWEVLNRYFAGQLTVEQVVQELDRQLRMMQLES